MKQSYKIFINDFEVILAQHKQKFNIPKELKNVRIYYIEQKEILKKLIIAMEVNTLNSNVIFVADDLKWLKNQFFSYFKIIEAAGGLIRNENGEVLMIYRKGKWDLPKGKIEKTENYKEGALREVKEETNVDILSLEKKIGITYHTYKLKDKWVLKKTHWFLMSGTKDSKLIPQLNEGIKKTLWCSKKEIKQHLKNSYPSIYDVFEFEY